MKLKDKGFTLLEILLVIGIMGVIAIFTIGISHSIRNTVQMNDTRGRMNQIAAKAREFYRAHESLPAPATTPADSVPVEDNALNMEQKYRLDAWGQYFFYTRVEVTPSGAPIMTYIKGISVNGRTVAGVLISGGPNQVIDGSFVAGTAPYGYLAGGTPATVAATGDDIVIPIDVGQEAIEIALDELKVLQSKVKAIDALYEGIDNSSPTNSTIDESGCVPALPDDSAGCPPTVLVAASGGNDPNCGTATLDTIDFGVYYGCSAAGALRTILTNYSLGDPQFRLDPWGMPYVWGRGAQVNPSVTALVINGCTIERAAGDCRDHYHKFFSQGPSTTTNADDIIP